MKPSTYRRVRRRTASHEATNAKKESGQEQSFFGEASHETFFQPSPVIQRKCEQCEEEDKNIQRQPEKKEDDKELKRLPEKKEEEKLQKMEDGGSAGVASGVNNYVKSLNGKGSSLPSATNQFFSEKMGYDFSDVKIHTGKDAAQSAKDVHAKAFTVGDHIVFNEGQYNTQTAEGKKLVAHELTHVMQNKPKAENPILHRQTSTPVPSTATVDPDTHITTFVVNHVNVVVEPDQTLARGTTVRFHGQRYTVKRSGALTVSSLRPHLAPSFTGTGRRKRVSSVSLSFTLYIKTYFGTGASSADASAYGRGTTADDIAAGNTSLGFHESRHGQDYLDYIARNPLPQITLAVPASITDYNAAVRQFNRQMTAYFTSMSEYSHTNTDMVGTPEP